MGNYTLKRQGMRLSPSELKVMAHMTEGLTDKQIAKSLDLSINTVKDRAKSIYLKLGVNNRTQAAVWAARNPDSAIGRAYP